MATISEIKYLADLRTEAIHVYSGTVLQTDAPLDNHGLAQRFSPTDLVATALGSCMLSIMGIASRAHSINIDGTAGTVEKIMGTDPRRIVEIKIQLTMPTAQQYTTKQKTILENAAMTCPVFNSLHPALIKSIDFIWPQASE
jgi:putative redox protein